MRRAERACPICAEFHYYDHHRYHEGMGNVAPADVYYGWQEAILKRREEQKRVTLEDRFRYNRSRLKQGSAQPRTVAKKWSSLLSRFAYTKPEATVHLITILLVAPKTTVFWRSLWPSAEEPS